MDKTQRDALRTVALEAYEKGEFKLAAQSYSDLIVYEENPEHYYRRAISELQLGNGDKAFADLSHIVELEPENPFWLACRAFVHERLGRIDEAIEDYERVIEMDPKDAVAHNNLGLLYEKQGRMEEAKKLVVQADLLDEARKFRKEQGSQIPEEPTIDKQTYSGLLKKVFSDRSELREFFKFVRNGFKLKS